MLIPSRFVFRGLGALAAVAAASCQGESPPATGDEAATVTVASGVAAGLPPVSAPGAQANGAGRTMLVRTPEREAALADARAALATALAAVRGPSLADTRLGEAYRLDGSLVVADGGDACRLLLIEEIRETLGKKRDQLTRVTRTIDLGAVDRAAVTGKDGEGGIGAGLLSLGRAGVEARCESVINGKAVTCQVGGRRHDAIPVADRASADALAAAVGALVDLCKGGA